MVVSLFVVMGSHLIAGDWQSSLLSLLPLLIVLVVGFFISRWIFKKLSKLWSEFLEELERYY
jgi:flagellar biosynthesis protein FliQ